MAQTSRPMLTQQYVESYLSSLNCPRSLTVLILFRHAEHDQISKIEFDPADYNSLVSARDSLAATAFLSKNKFLKTSFDIKRVALDSFAAGEAKCRQTNRRIYRGLLSPATYDILHIARRKIRHVLGPAIPWDLIFDKAGWGPGSTTNIPRRFATSPNKFDSKVELTSDLHELLGMRLSQIYPNWDPHLEIRNSCKVITVPKNAKTDRTIAVEPGLNLWFQKGIGGYIRSRLMYKGIDLKDQTKNQKLAQIGSRDDTLATIDFKAASDCISKSLVQELLPSNWYQLLDSCRSKLASVEGSVLMLEKFSSMGNGFTFELESLIFWSIASAVNDYLATDNTVSVFGDDVIIPSTSVALFTSVCEDVGFTINTSKSYSSGFYRESCGSHYWRGVCVKPIFQKEPLNGIEATVKAANNVRRLSHRRNAFLGCDRDLRSCWLLLSKALGVNFPRVSDGYGDCGLIENIYHPLTKTVRNKHGLEGFSVRVYVSTPVMKFYDSKGLYLSKIKSIGNKENEIVGNEIPLPMRNRILRKKISVPRWYDLGKWF